LKIGELLHASILAVSVIEVPERCGISRLKGGFVDGVFCRRDMSPKDPLT
jgi:hypothetical protein